jgi:hypothetical protein
MLSVIASIMVYVLKQYICQDVVKWQHIVYIMILMLYTKPVLEQAINKLANFN